MTSEVVEIECRDKEIPRNYFEKGLSVRNYTDLVSIQESIYYSPEVGLKYEWEGALSRIQDIDAVALQHKASEWRM